MSMSIPRHARVAIVGGGIAGCSVAYHLTRLGWRDVVLLEQGELAGGTTWHAAGQVGRLRTNSAMARINVASARMYSQLEAETGMSVSWRQVGSINVARTPERLVQFRRTAGMAEYLGIESHDVSPREAREKFPLLEIKDVCGAQWVPHDGLVEPADCAKAIAQGARNRGAKMFEGVRVTAIRHVRGRVIGVTASQSGEPIDIDAENVVLCGGMWSRQLGLMCGVTIPLWPVEHHYVVSNDVGQDIGGWPMGRDFDGAIYYRGYGHSVLSGAFQHVTKPWNVDRVPDDFRRKLFEPDWDHYAAPLQALHERIPIVEKVGIAKFVNGPESFTPDNNFLLGETPELRGLFVAAGFNSAGIACAGGAGEALAQWMNDGEQPFDLWSVDIRRFGPQLNNRTFLCDRVSESLGLHYRMAWPNIEFESGRNLRLSALHDRMKAAGACFGQKAGWERPLWFADKLPSVDSDPGAMPTQSRGHGTPSMQYSFGKQNWQAHHAAEHRACRETVAVFDQSSFAKFVLQGRDAAAVLQRLCANDIDGPVGKLVYTPLLNSRGTFESDLTVVRLAHDRFYLITATSQAVRDADWIRRNLQDGERAELVDVTGSAGVIGVQGPRSRELLARITDADLSHAAFPFATARRIDLGASTVLAIRITYVGELGWELHVPVEQMTAVYDAIVKAGDDLGARNAGTYAINSLRLEKGYRAWGADISPDDTPLEAGLGFAVKFDKPVAFLGREALLAQKSAGVRKRMVSLVLDDPEPMLWGGERIFRDGACVGYTSSAAYGHTLGAAVALGYVCDREQPDRAATDEWIRSGKYAVDIAGVWAPARVSLRAPYDPGNERIRG